MKQEQQFKYLFICEGNIGRSQMARAFYENKTGREDSLCAGTLNVAEKYGTYLGNHPSTNDIVKVMLEVGINISHQLIKQFTQQMLDNAEIIVVLCAKEKCPEEITSRTNVRYREIADPFTRSIEEIREVRDEVEKVVDILIS